MASPCSRPIAPKSGNQPAAVRFAGAGATLYPLVEFDGRLQALEKDHILQVGNIYAGRKYVHFGIID